MWGAQAIMRRRQLKVLVEVHGSQEGLGGNLTTDEIFVIQVLAAKWMYLYSLALQPCRGGLNQGRGLYPGCAVSSQGALDLSRKTAAQACTPLDKASAFRAAAAAVQELGPFYAQDHLLCLSIDVFIVVAGSARN